MSMKNVSLSEQLEDHLAANEEYRLMKQVDTEATQATLDTVRTVLEDRRAFLSITPDEIMQEIRVRLKTSPK